MVNKHGLSRHIPDDVKMQVRSKCGFGCVVCGSIPYDYDHLSVPYVDATEHDPNDIVLLCPTHHRLKTNSMLSVESLAKAKRNRSGLDSEARFKLSATSDTFDVIWGTNALNNSSQGVVVDGVPILTLSRTENDLEPVVISGEFRDYMGRLICLIENNEFISRAENIGDLSVIKNRFSYKVLGGRTGLEFTISERALHITDVFHVKNDAHVIVKNGILQAGNLLNAPRYSDFRVDHCETAIDIESNFEGFSFEGIDPSLISGGMLQNMAISHSSVGVAVRGMPRLRITTNYDRTYCNI